MERKNTATEPWVLESAYEQIPRGSENAISIEEYTNLLVRRGIILDGRDNRRKAQDILNVLRKDHLVVTLNYGVFVPVKGDEDCVRHYLNRERHRISEISKNLVLPQAFLNEEFAE